MAPTVRERVRYAFDALMARGTWALLGWHLVVALAAVLVVSVLVVALGLRPVDAAGEPLGFGAVVWTTLMHAITPSTITKSEGSEAWRGLMMLATVFGILLVGSLVGVLVTNVTRRFEGLREGRSRVLERDHTLIIGWSRQLPTIVSELARANESRGGGCVVVYADHDKLWMEGQLRAQLGRRGTGRTRVVVRAGDPTDPRTLDVVSPAHARAIIVLAPEGARDDTRVMRALLAVGRTEVDPERDAHVVTELRDPRNIDVAALTGPRRTEVLLIGDLVAKIAVQTCLQAGLSMVYEELLSFSGNEIYFVDAGPSVGRSFGEALHDFEDATPIGVRDGEGRVIIKPAMDRRIGADERLIVIAVDDDRVAVRPFSGAIDEAVLVAAPARAEPKPIEILILGWNQRVPAIVAGLEAYAEAGSRLLVVGGGAAAGEALAQLRPSLTKLALEHRSADIGDRDVLETLAPQGYDHVMVLPDDAVEEPTQADAEVLVALLHLRDLAGKAQRRFSIVSEMRDVRSRDLAEVARADDFIISDRLIGLLLAQIAEHADLGAVFAELLEPGGAEIDLRPAADYVQLGRAIDPHALVEAGRRREEVVIGIHREGHERPNLLNPHKRRSEALTFGAGDKIIVLAGE